MFFYLNESRIDKSQFSCFEDFGGNFVVKGANSSLGGIWFI